MRTITASTASFVAVASQRQGVNSACKRLSRQLCGCEALVTNMTGRRRGRLPPGPCVELPGDPGTGRRVRVAWPLLLNRCTCKCVHGLGSGVCMSGGCACPWPVHPDAFLQGDSESGRVCGVCKCMHATAHVCMCVWACACEHVCVWCMCLSLASPPRCLSPSRQAEWEGVWCMRRRKAGGRAR